MGKIVESLFRSSYPSASAQMAAPAEGLQPSERLMQEYHQSMGMMLHVLLAVILALFAVAVVVHWDAHVMMIFTVITLMMLAIEAAYFKGFYASVPVMMVFSLICTSVGVMIAYGTVRGMVAISLVGALMASGIFLTRRALTMAVVVVCTVLAVLVHGEMHQWFRAPRLTTGWDTWLSYCIVLIGLTANVYNSRRVTVRALHAQTQELRRAEQAQADLQAGREHLAMIYHSSPGAIVVLEGPRRVYVDVNEAFERMFGVTRYELIGRDKGVLSFWADAGERDRALDALKKDGELRDYLAKGRRSSGELFDMRLSSKVAKGSDPEIVVALINDVTEQRRRETLLSDMVKGFSGEVGEAMMGSLARYLARALGADQVLAGELMAASPEAEAEAEATGERSFPGMQQGASISAFDSLYSAPRASMERMADTSYIHVLGAAVGGQSQALEEETDMLTRMLAGQNYNLPGTPCQMAMNHEGCFTVMQGLSRRFSARARDQRPKAEAYAGMALRDGDGAAMGVLCVIWAEPQQWDSEKEALVQVFASRAGAELTRLKRDREIARLHGDLERRVIARTAELAATNQELESFAYSVSHDLRSPLRAIDAFTRVLTEQLAGRIDEQEQALLARVVKNAGRMNELITDLIDLAHVNQGEIDLQRVDISAIAAEVVEALHDAEPTRVVTVTIEPGLRAWGDARLSRIVLENLLGNAWKYTGLQAQAYIHLGKLRTVRPSAPVAGELSYLSWLFVRDNGAGFDMAYADKLFKPFHRLHHEREFEGTGIGLATVHRILERHGGAIEAHSTPGKGAEFVFRFAQRTRT